MDKPKMFTQKTRDGIRIANWRQDWYPGQIVKNPLKNIEFFPIDKTSRRLGCAMPRNHLFGVESFRVLYAGPSRERIGSHGDGWVAAAGNEVEVSIV